MPFRRRPTRRSTTAVALALAGSVALGGCGQKDAPEGADAAPKGTIVTADGQVIPEPAVPSTFLPATTTTVDPGTLPQTETKPSVDSADLERRVRAMWDGIVEDDPKLAQQFFFPLSAYKQVKALQDPTSDWNGRLIAIYDSEIHALHAGLGKDPSKATFEGIDIPMGNAQWINPGVEYNKLGYWRVYGTQVRYTVDGVKKAFPVQSLISWRGEWYVVHLTAVPR